MSAARWPIPVVSGPATAGIWLCSVTAGGCRSPVSASPGWLTPPKRGRVSNCHAIAAPGPATCGSRSMRWPGCRKACGFATTTDYHPTGWAGPISRRSSTGWPTSSPRARSAATTATSSAAAFGPRCPGSAPWGGPGPVGSPPGCPATSRSGVTTSPPRRTAANPAGTCRRRSWPCCAPIWTACGRPNSRPQSRSASTPAVDLKTSSTSRWTACSGTRAASPCWSMTTPKATAAVITAQQSRVQQRFPATPAGELKLLPSPRRNPDGRRPMTIAMLGDGNRRWVDTLGPLHSRDGAEFDKSKIVPYAYRHSYAQRHADAGVGIDVLAELLDHRNLNVTRTYYRVGEDRRRAAVDTVTAMSFDRHGNRVWREAAALLDSEHARYAVGEIAVPYGRCTEPSNVAAGGGACPVRFRCAGCDHFRTDVSHLPDLIGYLDDLLQTRERLAAAIDGVDEWARADAAPSQQEITRIRWLIGRIDGDLGQASDTERTVIDEAVTVMRRHRAAFLGMPSTRATAPDVCPEATA